MRWRPMVRLCVSTADGDIKGTQSPYSSDEEEGVLMACSSLRGPPLRVSIAYIYLSDTMFPRAGVNHLFVCLLFGLSYRKSLTELRLDLIKNYKSQSYVQPRFFKMRNFVISPSGGHRDILTNRESHGSRSPHGPVHPPKISQFHEIYRGHLSERCGRKSGPDRELGRP